MRAVVVGRVDPGGDEPNLEELKALAHAAGYEVVGTILQRRKEDPRYNIGRGKAEELRDYVKGYGVDSVIFFNELKPLQVLNLREMLGVKVIDRFQLILEIFARHAGSKEAKLQIELARLKYELPRVREWVRRAKMRELPGFLRGPGSYQVDVYYRAIRRRIIRIRKELENIRKRKLIQRKMRDRIGFPTLVLTGYTNAGKTTLFNRLAKESKPVSASPFSTLATVTRLTDIYGRKVMVSDTIGFIDKLPPLLIEAFYTTLEEIRLADLLLLVIDSSEPPSEIERKLNASSEALKEVGVIDKPTIAILNKVDMLDESELRERMALVSKYHDVVVPISAITGMGIDELKKAIYDNLPKYGRMSLKVSSFDDLKVLDDVKFVQIKSIKELDDGLLLEIEGPEETLMRIQGSLSREWRAAMSI